MRSIWRGLSSGLSFMNLVTDVRWSLRHCVSSEWLAIWTETIDLYSSYVSDACDRKTLLNSSNCDWFRFCCCSKRFRFDRETHLLAWISNESSAIFVSVSTCFRRTKFIKNLIKLSLSVLNIFRVATRFLCCQLLQPLNSVRTQIQISHYFLHQLPSYRSRDRW